MKRIVIGLMVMLLMVFTLAGCGDKVKETFIDIEKMSAEVLESADFRDEVMELKDDVLGNIYTSLKLEDIAKYKVYVCSTNAKAEEIALFEAKNEESAQKIYDAVKVRIEDLKYGIEDYIPEELKNVENAVLVREGKYVLLGIGENYDKIKSVFDKWISGK